MLSGASGCLEPVVLFGRNMDYSSCLDKARPVLWRQPEDISSLVVLPTETPASSRYGGCELSPSRSIKKCITASSLATTRERERQRLLFEMIAPVKVEILGKGPCSAGGKLDSRSC